MKSKLLIAREPESSQTTRITVEDYASMFREIPIREIDEFFKVVQTDLDMFGDDKRRELMARYMK